MKYIFLVLSIGFLGLSGVSAQSGYTVSGTVLDSAGAAVAGADVALSGTDVRFERSSKAGPDGRFEFSAIRAGSYKLSAGAPSFAVSESVIALSGDVDLDVKLVPEHVAVAVSVTAGLLAGTPESLHEIPGSIERITPIMLENARVHDFSEALRKVTGVNVREEEGFGLRPNIGIRGTNPTRSTKVLLLEDGIPLSYAPYGDNSSYYHPPVERYESVEVLKGSGQIAYGPQTIAGLINYVTPNPPERPSFDLKLQGGNRSFFNGSAGFGATYKKLGFITNFSHKRGDGSRQNTDFKLYDFSSKITYELNEKNVFTGKFTFFREDSNLTYTGATLAEYTSDPRGNIFKNDFFFGRRYGLSLQHVGVLSNNAVLTTSVYSNYFSRDWWRQTSNSGERPFRLFRPADPTNPISDPDCLSLADLNTTCGNRGNLRNYLTSGIESRLSVNFDLGSLRNELTVGARVHAEDQDRIGKYGDLPDSRDGLTIEDNERKAMAFSGFVQHRFVWNDIAVTPGIRFEKINYQRTNRIFNSGEGVTGDTEVTEVVPGIGLAYSGISRVTLFAGVHRGFAPPRVEDVITDSGGVRDLDSELSWNYEAGLRARPVRGAELSATFFRNDYENQIVASSIASGTQFTNGGETLQQGFEFSGGLDSGQLFKSPHNLYLRTAYTFLPNAEFRGERFSSITSAATLDLLCPAERRVASNRCSIGGNRLPYTPKHQLTTSLGYSHPRGFDAFVENVYIGRQFADDLNSVNSSANGQLGAIPAQTYWNATTNYTVEKWKTTFFITAKNIFDRTFIVDRSRGILPSNPRLLSAGFKLKF